MILFEKSIVLAATFLLIVLFIGYLVIKFKNPQTQRLEALTNNTQYEKLQEEQEKYQERIKKMIKRMELQINNNTKNINGRPRIN